MRRHWLGGLLVLVSAVALANEERWSDTLEWIRAEFPDVPRVATTELADALARQEPVLLLDARASEEYEVSHIAGAIRAEGVDQALAVVREHGRGRKVIVYCSVGYRSARLVNQLQRHGIDNAFNLEGSLFQWANEGRPVVRGSDPAAEVHPYDADWGELLDEDVRAD